MGNEVNNTSGDLTPNGFNYDEPQELQTVRRTTAKHSRYLDLFLSCRCAPDMLLQRLFPNAKEITESFAMYEATTHLEGYEWNNDEVTCFVVGDGRKPRTAATFAYRTAWECFSIDPDLANTKFDIKRLTTIRRKIEEIEYYRDNRILIILPHSHAPIKSCLENLLSPKRALITMDCCVKNDPGIKPDFCYRDPNVWSPKNEIKIWQSI